MDRVMFRWSPVVLMMIAGSVQSLGAGPFGASLDLSTLNGTDGFVINGIDPGDRCGTAVSYAGDINGDGIADLIVSAPFASPTGIIYGGECYVVFGGAGIGAGGAFSPSTLNGANGFVVNGASDDDFIGSAVSSAGDINGDGVDDFVIGAYYASVPGNNNSSNEGRGFVVFGGPGVGSGGSVDLSTLNGTDGFVFNGVDSFDGVGRAVSSAGDINGDGLVDLVFGAPDEVYGGYSVGASYVVFGSASVGASGSLDRSSLNGTNGFQISKYDLGTECGRGVSYAGDLNGDGVDDLIVGAPGEDPNGVRSGESYVIFGGAGVGGGAGVFDPSNLTGVNGFTINGVDAGDRSGFAVSFAGDFNGDSVDDLIIGGSNADPNGVGNAGECYVVFGGAGIGAGGAFELSSLNGANGFTINGIDFGDLSGYSVSGAGDVNGDGVGDVIIGAKDADPNGGSSGASYVVFGGPGVGASGALELSALDGTNGFTINGVNGGDQAGISVSSAGDVNGDGVGDLIIGAGDADPNGQPTGAAYVVFGRCTIPADLNVDGAVDTADLGILIGQFGTPGPGADINGDGAVDTADLGILISAFGTACP